MSRTNSHSEELKAELFADYLKSRTKDPVYFWGTILGILMGGVFCFTGFITSLLGISGNVEWIIEATNLKSRMINASPGVLFALFGGIIIWRYKPSRKEVVDFGTLMSSYQEYLHTYPTGEHAEKARKILQETRSKGRTEDNNEPNKALESDGQ